MRVMVLVKATKTSESGAMPTEQDFAEMGAFNEELVKAGVMAAGEGLLPSSRGRRIHFSNGKKTVTEGPFPEPESLVAGFWIWNVKSMDEAVEWAKRCPDPMPGEDSVLELRQIAELEDFGDAITPELREQEERLRAATEKA
ncbi:MAG TPA: YciI family protein [Myxococcaceae bacterium]|nr:YciI family protein [Myxococcaceae bacterium]